MKKSDALVAIAMIETGNELVNSIIGAIYASYKVKCVCQPNACCDSCNEYAKLAPEVHALDEFRSHVGTRFLGSWTDKSRPEYKNAWCTTHDEKEAIDVLKAIVND